MHPPSGQSSGKIEWWTEEIRKIIDKKKAYETWLNTIDLEDLKAYSRLNREAKT